MLLKHGSKLLGLHKDESVQISGISLDPTRGKNGELGIFEAANISENIKKSGGSDIRLDIRNCDKLRETICEIKPDVVFHLAAQPLVKRSYDNPRETFESNIMGTFNVLDAVQYCNDFVQKVRAQLIITTDKVYKNHNQTNGYTEDCELGVNPDPYSSSKACADILTQCMILHPKYNVPTCITRGGNVIGGGDVSFERLMVDIISDAKLGRSTFIRYPDATRPWQHVLDCLDGYISIVRAMLIESNRSTNLPSTRKVSGQAFNVAPAIEDLVKVRDIVNYAVEVWNNTDLLKYENSKSLKLASWQTDSNQHYHEANLLSLDPKKTEQILKWSGLYHWQKAIELTVEWEKAVLINFNSYNSNVAYQTTMNQIDNYYKERK